MRLSMTTRTRHIRGGMTQIELIVAVAILCVLLFSVGVTLADGPKAWESLYRRAFQGASTDALTIRKTFESTVRKSTLRECSLPTDGSWANEVTLYYYKDAGGPGTSSDADGFSRLSFNSSSKKLTLDYGDKATGAVAGSVLLSSAAQACQFRMRGAAIEMMLQLKDNDDARDMSIEMTISCSAIRQNGQ
jgi:hypothetical protein